MEHVYIHYPFCRKICSYCDFAKQFYNPKVEMVYIDALINEIKTRFEVVYGTTYDKNKIHLTSIYFGGGTPSLLSEEDLIRIFDYIPSADEITLEMNPEDVTIERIQMYQRLGINRLSIGVQTLKESFLTSMNRSHTHADVRKALDVLREVKFPNVSLDFMFGLPDQSKHDIDEVFQCIEAYCDVVKHISFYNLIVEPHTVLHQQVKQKTIVLPEDEEEAHEYAYIQEQLELQGFIQYEISNFSKKGFESKHNLAYWKNKNYLSAGLGAHGYLGDIRYENTRNMHAYCEGKYERSQTTISHNDQMVEHMFLGLRLVEGVKKSDFLERFAIPCTTIFHSAIEKHKDGLYETPTHLALKKEQFFISNEILVDFIELKEE